MESFSIIHARLPPPSPHFSVRETVMLAGEAIIRPDAAQREGLKTDHCEWNALVGLAGLEDVGVFTLLTNMIGEVHLSGCTSHSSGQR